MTRPFARAMRSAARGAAPKPPFDEHELKVMAVLRALKGGEVCSYMEDDFEPAARALFSNAFNRNLSDDEYDSLVADDEQMVVQAARIQKLCCEPHWGWLPLCVLNPFEGMNGNSEPPVTCPLSQLCAVPSGWMF